MPLQRHAMIFVSEEDNRGGERRQCGMHRGSIPCCEFRKRNIAMLPCIIPLDSDVQKLMWLLAPAYF
jgi:hypothetical protein